MLSDRQKALNERLLIALKRHLDEWPGTTFDEALEVFDAVRHSIEVSKQTTPRKTIRPID